MRRLILAAALATIALAPATAHASAYSQVLAVYQATGSVPPCKFSSQELAASLRGIDTYGQQYFADFTEAVDSALAQRASGACTPGLVPRLRAGRVSGPLTPLPGSITSPTDSGIPAPMLVMAGLALLAALGFAAGGLMAAFGWDPPWAARWRHACGEASYRAGAGLDALTDWWRSGR